MTTVENDDLVLRLRLVRQRHLLGQRKPVVAVLAVAAAEIAAGGLQVAVAGEIEQRYLAVIRKKLPDAFLERCPRYRVRRPGSGKKLDAKIHRDQAKNITLSINFQPVGLEV